MLKQKRLLLRFATNYPPERRVIDAMKLMPDRAEAPFLRLLAIKGHEDFVRNNEMGIGGYSTIRGMARETVQVELRVNPMDPECAHLLQDLGLRATEHGMKRRFLMSRILRGFDLLLADLAGIKEEGGGDVARMRVILEQRADFGLGYYSCLRALIDAGFDVEFEPKPLSAAPVPATTEKKSPPIPSEQQTAALQKPDQESIEASEPLVSPAHDWSSFRNLAGRKN